MTWGESLRTSCDMACLICCIILLLVIFAVIIGAIIFLIRLRRQLKNASCNLDVIKFTAATPAGNHDPELFEVYESNDLYVSQESINYETVNNEPLRQNNLDEMEVYECNDQYMNFESNNYEAVN